MRIACPAPTDFDGILPAATSSITVSVLMRSIERFATEVLPRFGGLA